MKGASEFHKIINRAFNRGLGELQKVKRGDFVWGNVLFSTDEHARGETIRIFLIDGDEKLEVYGVVSGNPGWTETYGWLKRGSWVKPILKYLKDLESQIANHDEHKELERRNKEREANKQIQKKVDKFNEMFKAAL